MNTFWQDVRYGLRMLRTNRSFAAVAVLTLALGIGANTAIFSLVNVVLLRSLPFNEPERLVWVWATLPDRDKAFFSIPEITDYRERNQTLEQIAAVTPWGANLTEHGEAERVQGARISAHAFQMLGARAAIGRTLLAADDEASSQQVVVLTHGLWQRRFGADPGLIGKTLTLNGESYTVVGVLPPDFVFPWLEAEMAAPLKLASHSRRTDRGTNFLRMFGRLKPGVSKQQAQADLAIIARQLQQEHPDTNAKRLVPRVLTLREEIVGDYERALFMLFIAVGMVLLIGCTNLANLLLARASARHKEMAVRMALGATRGRLMQQLLTESVILAAVGGALGLLLAVWGVDWLLALSPANLPRAHDAGLDLRVLGFTLALSLLVGIGFGLAPALQASKTNLNEELKAGGRGTSGGRNRVRGILVAAEMALALVLLVSAGLFVRSFARLQSISPGFEIENLLLVRMSLPAARYATLETITNFYDKLAPRIKNLPGVAAVGAANVLPLSGSNVRTDFNIVGRPAPALSDVPAAQNRWVSPGYFRAMRIPIIQGREFTEQDQANTQGVAVIDETVARRYWPHGNPIGAHLNFFDHDYEIVGIAGGVKHNSLDEEPVTTIYAPIAQTPPVVVSFLANNLSFAVRTEVEPLTLQTAVRREVQAVDRDVPASSIRTMEQFLSASVAPRRFNLLLLGLFAGAALLLAGTGLYALIAYSVTQRTHEIGVRMALGAQASDVLKLVVGQGMKLALTGVAMGLIASFVLTRLMKSLLFGVTATDPVTFAVVALLLTVVALLACYLPARRAMRVDPMVALRYE